jgi:serine protease Do
MPQILRKHRLAALLGAAIVAVPLAAPFLLTTQQANAATTGVAGIVAPGGSFASIVAADKPAVVTITTTMKAENVSSDDGSPFGGNSPFDEQFRQFFGQNMPSPHQAPQQQERAEALGSGFVISPDGYIVTNNHVIDKAISIKVTLDDGTEVPAKLIGADPKSDLAVVKITPPKPLKTVSWGDSDKAAVGDQILAFGNPFGIGTTVTAGIVSARGRDLHSGPYDDFLQIDAPINHGNSGGPLVDMEGHVIGIDTAIYSPNGGSVGVGFAIPSDQAQKVVAKLMKDGSIKHGFIGIEIQPVTSDVANAIGLQKPEGALVASVGSDSPADKAGVTTGDVVTAFNGTAVQSPRDLSRMVADLTPGDKANLEVWRHGASKTLSITVGNNDGDQTKLASNGDQNSADQHVPTIGLGLGDITADVRQQLDLPRSAEGAVIETVAPDKPAADAGLTPGDVIISVNQKTVSNAREAKAAVAEAGRSGKKSVLLLVRHDGNQSFVAVPFSEG